MRKESSRRSAWMTACSSTAVTGRGCPSMLCGPMHRTIPHRWRSAGESYLQAAYPLACATADRDDDRNRGEVPAAEDVSGALVGNEQEAQLAGAQWRGSARGDGAALRACAVG